jgi:hypothetical protein
VIVHKLIETLANVGTDECSALSASIASATKFEIRGEHFIDDNVQDYALLLLNSGLLRLPFPNCYFETDFLSGDPETSVKVAFLAIEAPCRDRVFISMWGYTPDVGWRTNPKVGGWSYENGQTCLLRRVGANEEEHYKTRIVSHFLSFILAFMDLKETKREAVTIKPRVNAHRIAQERQPFHDHTILTISKAARDALRTKADAALITRRAHWRRGHLRHLPDKIVPVAPALVRGEGFLSKDYRIT